MVGWCVGGYLGAAALAISAGARPSNPQRAAIRLAVMAVVAVLGGALITRSIAYFENNALTTPLLVLAAWAAAGAAITVAASARRRNGARR